MFCAFAQVEFCPERSRFLNSTYIHLMQTSAVAQLALPLDVYVDNFCLMRLKFALQSLSKYGRQTAVDKHLCLRDRSLPAELVERYQMDDRWVFHAVQVPHRPRE